jgi:hypothetical protein
MARIFVLFLAIRRASRVPHIEIFERLIAAMDPMLAPA